MAQGAAASSSKLYTPRLLGLSARLADYPLTEDFTHRAQGRSPVCGSTIDIGARVDDAGAIEAVGMQVAACAVGQSSAALLATGARGLPASAIASALAEIEAWLAGSKPLPQWPGFDALEPALPHTGRHSAILLPWKAMAQALSSPVAAG
jgi:NifU-like protein involved in Fe-S cluster formation